MRYAPHSAQDFTGALGSLLPPGRAWAWAEGSFGHGLLAATAAEPARLEAGIPEVLRAAVEAHRPAFSSWHISEYRRVAQEALAGVAESLPRKPFAVGSHAGDRAWSARAPEEGFYIPLVEVYHLFGPMAAGRHCGDGSGRDPAARCWSAWRSRHILLVRYYRGVVDPGKLWDALAAFRQTHVALWFEDITGVGGFYAKD